jgi:hypothetical protein
VDLEQFVEQSLIQIIAGVGKAQNSTRLAGKHHSEADVVNPRFMAGADMSPKGRDYFTVDRNIVQFVDFDVAVSSETGSNLKGDASIKVLGFGIGTQAGSEKATSAVSRIKFQVPIVLPRAKGD